MSIQQLLENRVSTVQTKMTGGRVSDEHIHQALKATTAIPIHGKKNPLHFVVFNYENRGKALDLLYKTKAKKIEREPFNELCSGIGTVILGFIKKNISEKFLITNLNIQVLRQCMRCNYHFSIIIIV